MFHIWAYFSLLIKVFIILIQTEVQMWASIRNWSHFFVFHTPLWIIFLHFYANDLKKVVNCYLLSAPPFFFFAFQDKFLHQNEVNICDSTFAICDDHFCSRWCCCSCSSWGTCSWHWTTNPDFFFMKMSVFVLKELKIVFFHKNKPLFWLFKILILKQNRKCCGKI